MSTESINQGSGLGTLIHTPAHSCAVWREFIGFSPVVTCRHLLTPGRLPSNHAAIDLHYKLGHGNQVPHPISSGVQLYIEGPKVKLQYLETRSANLVCWCGKLSAVTSQR